MLLACAAHNTSTSTARVLCCCPPASPALVAAHADAHRRHLDVLLHHVLLLHGHGTLPGHRRHGEKLLPCSSSTSSTSRSLSSSTAPC